MACEGAKERRDGLIDDMVTLRDHLELDALRYAAAANGVVINASDEVTVFFVGYLAAAISRLGAAVIALAGPCCEDCDEKPVPSSMPSQSSVPPIMPPQDWET